MMARKQREKRPEAEAEKEEEQKCRMPGCDRAVQHVRSGLCKRCYAFLHYWKNRSVTEQMRRLDQIEFWEKRARAVFRSKRVLRRVK